jgi:Uma2 family endonuclease
VPTAVVVVEILSPDDETFDKFGFYAGTGVDELIVVDPAERLIRCFRHDGDDYAETAGSDLLAVSSLELTTRLNWPA